MRSALLLTLVLFCASTGQAQPPAPPAGDAKQAPASAPNPQGAIEKRAERIRVEDAGARIDELRIGGETRSIDVKPKGGLPAYQIQPASGERSWKVLGF